MNLTSFVRSAALALLALAATPLASATMIYSGGIYSASATYASGFANAGLIPDSGEWSDTRTISDFADLPNPRVVGVSVTLNLSGGFNGDLYAYLSHGGQSLVLLNRVGTSGSDVFGYDNAGMNVTLADSGVTSIHNYGGSAVPTGTFAPDSGAYTFAGVFGGLNPNGDWTLFIADRSSGETSTLGSWSLQVQAVPEPANVALVIFGLGAAGVAAARKFSPRLRRSNHR